MTPHISFEDMCDLRHMWNRVREAGSREEFLQRRLIAIKKEVEARAYRPPEDTHGRPT